MLVANICIAGGEILDPAHQDELEVGWTIQPYGSIDPIHAEEGDSVQVDFLAKKGVAPFDTVHIKSFTVEGDWWAGEEATIPGGDFVNGFWIVTLRINGELESLNTGRIIAPEE